MRCWRPAERRPHEPDAELKLDEDCRPVRFIAIGASNYSGIRALIDDLLIADIRSD